jgi:hypothetical protein
MLQVTQIDIRPLYLDGKYYVLTNAKNVTYRSSDIDELIRFFISHTQQKATKLEIYNEPRTE